MGSEDYDDIMDAMSHGQRDKVLQKKRERKKHHPFKQTLRVMGIFYGYLFLTIGRVLKVVGQSLEQAGEALYNASKSWKVG